MKILKGLVLGIITYISLFIILKFLFAIYKISYFTNTFIICFSIMAFLGVLGLVGLWLLFLRQNYGYKIRKSIILSLILSGSISVLVVSVALLYYSNGSFIDFRYTSYSLLILLVFTIYYTKKALFPKKSKLS